MSTRAHQFTRDPFLGHVRPECENCGSDNPNSECSPRAHKHQLGTIDKGIAADRGYIYPSDICDHDSAAICDACVVEFGPEGSYCPICARGV